MVRKEQNLETAAQSGCGGDPTVLTSKRKAFERVLPGKAVCAPGREEPADDSCLPQTWERTFSEGAGMNPLRQ